MGRNQVLLRRYSRLLRFCQVYNRYGMISVVVIESVRVQRRCEKPNIYAVKKRSTDFPIFTDASIQGHI